MDGILKCFNHIRISATGYILSRGKPTEANQDDWDFAMAAMVALGED